MSKQKGLIVGVILVAIILMAIGYAALGATPLTINGKAQAAANTENFKVYFTGDNTVKGLKGQTTESEFIEVEAVAESTTATVNFLRGLGLNTAGDSAYVILEIKNGSNEIDASSVNVKTPAKNTEVFEFDTVMCDETGTEISDYSVASGETTYVKVSVKLLKSPTDDAEASISVELEATPAEAK